MITGIRGLCNGLGPALYGFIFYIFHVELNELPMPESSSGGNVVAQYHLQQVPFFCTCCFPKKLGRALCSSVLQFDAVIHFVILTVNGECRKRFLSPSRGGLFN